MNLSVQLDLAQKASRSLALVSAEKKNEALQIIATELRENIPLILTENAKDMEAGRANGLDSILDRLLLTEERIRSIADSVEKIAKLFDSIGEVLYEKMHENGMKIQKIRVPIGVIGMIYESRPNVTVDAAVLALKSGNAIVLKGGKEAAFSNRILVKILRDAVGKTGIDSEIIQLLDGATRGDTAELMKAKGKIDVLIPRGSNALIKFVSENATVPIIETGASPVHIFVDASADVKKAAEICVNAKIRRISVCNSLDTILVHEQILSSFLSELQKHLSKDFNQKKYPAVEIHADRKSYKILHSLNYSNLVSATPKDYDMEWLDYIVNIKVVTGIDEVLEHIREHSFGHSESIITENNENAQRFLNEVDAACVYHNVSPAFTDGEEFGLGAEIGISTQKLHARGPFAVEALTTTKWIVMGNGQIRN